MIHQGQPDRRLTDPYPGDEGTSRVVWVTARPSADVITRTGWHPASTVATTDRAGSVSARWTLITVRVPGTSGPGTAAILARRAEAAGRAVDRLRRGNRAVADSSLVAYSHRPSGDTARPTGASPTGIAPR